MRVETRRLGWPGAGSEGTRKGLDGHDLGGRRQPSKGRRESGAVSTGQRAECFFPAERGVAGQHPVPHCARARASRPRPERRPGWAAGVPSGTDAKLEKKNVCISEAGGATWGEVYVGAGGPGLTLSSWFPPGWGISGQHGEQGGRRGSGEAVVSGTGPPTSLPG